jgi:phosphatidate cytidylyltransferase
VILPMQYVLVGTSLLNAFTVFIPVYVFFAIPVISALANDPFRFLERTAKIQWGITVTVYGMSHAPALLLLDLPGYQRARRVPGPLPRPRRRRRPARPGVREPAAAPQAGRARDQPLVLVARVRRRRRRGAVVGVLLYWVTPFKPLAALAMGAIAGAAGTLGEFVMMALKRDAGVRNFRGGSSVTGAVGLLDRVAPLCFAAPVFFHSVRGYFGI